MSPLTLTPDVTHSTPSFIVRTHQIIYTYPSLVLVLLLYPHSSNCPPSSFHFCSVRPTLSPFLLSLLLQSILSIPYFYSPHSLKPVFFPARTSSTPKQSLSPFLSPHQPTLCVIIPNTSPEINRKRGRLVPVFFADYETTSPWMTLRFVTGIVERS